MHSRHDRVWWLGRKHPLRNRANCDGAHVGHGYTEFIAAADSAVDWSPGYANGLSGWAAYGYL